MPQEGAVIAGRYRIAGMIGKGGMGAVYRAEHVNIGKTVALKVLLTNLDEEGEASRRFKQEAQAASKLTHPNIVNIYDFEVDNNRAFLTMDYLDGCSLEDLLSTHDPLPLPRFKHIMLQACKALGYAHKQGFVHRDIKPSNMMLVTRGDEEDTLVIVDFGLVKLLTPESPEQKLTSTNTLVGSPLYMSPEQCRGLEVDHRSDIYSLGCVMYRCLTGTLPIIGESPMDTLFKHVTSPPVAMREANAAAHVPLALEAVVMKCLQKEPGGRPQSMQELSAALESALPEVNAIPVTAGGAYSVNIPSIYVAPSGPIPRAAAIPSSAAIVRTRAKRSSVLALAATVTLSAVFGAVVICSLILFLVHRQPASDTHYEPVVTKIPEAESKQPSALEQKPVFKNVSRPNLKLASNLSAAKQIRHSAVENMQELAEKERLLEDESDSAFDADDWTKAFNGYKRCLQMEQRLLGSETNPAILPLVAKLTICADRLSDSDACVEYLNRFNDLFYADSAPIREDNKLLTALSKVAYNAKNYQLAEDLLEHAITVRQEHAPPHDRTLVELLAQLGSIYAQENKLADAEDVLKRAFEIVDKRNNPLLAWNVRTAYATILKQEGKPVPQWRWQRPNL